MCLKCLGKIILANSKGSQTTKLPPLELHDMIGFNEGSSTKSNVFERNGGTGLICKHSIGTGTSLLPPPPIADASYSIKDEEENLGEFLSSFGFMLS